MQDKTEIFFMEMNSPDELIRKDSCPMDLKIKECITPQWQFNRFLYQFIGGQWKWFDKLTQSDDEWEKYVSSENTRTWVAYEGGSIAGYYELIKKENVIEIIYFGLSGNYIGRGIGGYLLTHAVECAWAWNAERVILNTCTLDHPNALKNYMARGFKIYRKSEKK